MLKYPYAPQRPPDLRMTLKRCTVALVVSEEVSPLFRHDPHSLAVHQEPQRGAVNSWLNGHRVVVNFLSCVDACVTVIQSPLRTVLDPPTRAAPHRGRPLCCVQGEGAVPSRTRS